MRVAVVFRNQSLKIVYPKMLFFSLKTFSWNITCKPVHRPRFIYEMSLKVPGFRVSLAILLIFFTLWMRLGFPHICPTKDPLCYQVIIPQ